MAAFPTLGMNYAPPYGTTDQQLEADLTELKENFTHLRMGAPPFNYSQLQWVYHTIQMAKSMGFYVMWGITCPQSYQAAGEWPAFIAALPNIAEQALLLGVDEYLAGNEEDNHTSSMGPSIATVQQNLLTAWASIKSNIPQLKLTYSLALGAKTFWLTNPQGKGALDYLSVNIYDTPNGFASDVDSFVNTYGGSVINVSEFNASSGFTGLSESSHDQQIQGMVAKMAASSVRSAYLYCFDYDTTNNNQWDIRQPNGTFHLAYRQLTGARSRFSQ